MKSIGSLGLALLWGVLGACLLYAVLLLVGANVLGSIGGSPLQHYLVYGAILLSAPMGALAGLLGGVLGVALGWSPGRLVAVLSCVLLLAAIGFGLGWLWPLLEAQRRPPVVWTLLVFAALAIVSARIAWR